MQYTSLTPNLMVADVARSAHFYCDLLDFSIVNTVPLESPYDWAMVSGGDISVMFQQENSLKEELPLFNGVQPGRTSATLYIKMENVRKLYEKLQGQVEMVADLHTTFYNATEFSIKDPDGYVLTFAE